MKHYLLSTITFLILFGCGEEDFNDTKTVDEIIANAADSSKIQTRMVKGKELFFEINKQTPYSGWYKIMYPSGQVRLLSEVKEGLKDGKLVEWFENGQKKLEAIYLKGKPHGKSSFYYKNGQLEQEVELQNGLRQGKEITWFENGQVWEKTNYHHDKADGISKVWANNGDMFQELVFKNGNVVDIISPAPRWTASSIDLEMLWVSEGNFTMGSPTTETGRNTNETEHNVSLTQGFYLGKYEVTQAQYAVVMSGNSKSLNPSPSNWPNNPTRPVEQVSWDDVQIFLSRLNASEQAAGRLPSGWSYVLPTEAQWEYACRAGTSTMYSWGDSISSSNANYDDNVDETTPVGKYPANPWGFHDMHGNVWEWCADWYGDYPSGSVTYPIGPASYRAIRGGSWYFTGPTLRSASRNYDTPSYRDYDVGFRVGFKSSK